MYRDIPAELKELIEPVVAAHGCELVDVEVQRGRPGLLRVVVDGPEGDGRVPVDVLARISREIETQIDAADAVPGSYRLEVTSPGLDRVLGREKDFEAACGARVRITTRRALEGRRHFKGELVAFEEDTVRLRSEGKEIGIPFEEIEKANSIYEFTRDDFKGRAPDRDRVG